MTKVEPGDGSWIKEHNTRAQEPWHGYLQLLIDVEEVWKGQFTIVNDVNDSELEIKQPAEARAIIKKMNEMLSIRASKNYSVARFTNKDDELKTCDRLERLLYAFEADHFSTTGEDVFSLGGMLLLLRGKIGMHTIHEKNAKHPKVRVKLYDPTEYFPVYGDDGISWFTVERWMYRWELIEFFDNLSDIEVSKLAKKEIPDLSQAFDDQGKPYDANLNDQLQVIQYWNDDWMAWSVEDRLIQKYKHGWGRMTLREAKLGAMPLKDKRWSQSPFIGAIVDSLKLKASLASKALNAVQAFYYDRMVFQGDDGEVQVFTEFPKPGEVNNIGVGGKLTTISPQANQGMLKVLIDLLDNDIAKSTLPEPAWSSSSGDESGFRASLTLGQIKDSVADVRHQAEMCYGLVAGDVLWALERFAPAGGWEFSVLEPDGKNRIQTVTADDIGKHQKVNVRITPALPQDLLQMVTIANQITQPDPITGKRLVSVPVAKRITGLADVIGDTTEDDEQINWESLLIKDPEMQQLEIDHLKARHEMKIRDMRKEIKRVKDREMRREMNRTARDIEKGLTEDMVIPAEVLIDAAKMHQLAALIEQGMMPQEALDIVEQGAPLGMPGQMVAEGMGGQPPISPETQQLMQQLVGGQQPTGFTGYEGVNPMASPPAMQGAQPRRVLDQPAVEVDAIDTLMQRGGLPPAR